MTNGQVIDAALVLLGFFSVLAGLIVLLAWFLNRAAYRWEDRQALRAAQRRYDDLEAAFRLPAADCNVVRLHPPTVDHLRPRRGPAA
jgi:hypothetical protein